MVMAFGPYRIASLCRVLAGGALFLSGFAIDHAAAQDADLVERKLEPITNYAFPVPEGWDESVWLSMGSLWELESNDTDNEAGRLMPSFDWRGSRLIGNGGSTCGPMGSSVQPIYQVSGALTPLMLDRKTKSYSRFAVLENRLAVTVSRARKGCEPLTQEITDLFPLAARFEHDRSGAARIGLVIGKDRLDYKRDDKFAPYTGSAWRIESVSGKDGTDNPCGPLRIGHSGATRFRCCNTVSAHLRFDDDGVLTAGPSRRTRIGCRPDSVGNLMDNAVASALRGTISLDAEGRLVVTGADYAPDVVRFTPEAWLAPMEGDWTLTAIRRSWLTDGLRVAPVAEADSLESLGFTLSVMDDRLVYSSCSTRTVPLDNQRNGAIRLGKVLVKDENADCIRAEGASKMVDGNAETVFEDDATLTYGFTYDSERRPDTLTLTRSGQYGLLSYIFRRD